MKKITLLFLMVMNCSALLRSQCSTSYIYYVNPSNDGLVYFHDTTFSTPPNPEYYWNFGDGMTGYGNNPSHTYNASGTFYACLSIVDSSAGCSYTYCDSITVLNTSPFCYASFTPQNDSSGSLMFYDGSYGYMLSYLWDFGDGTTSTTPGVQTHTFPSPGYYSVCLSIHNPGSTCTDTFCDTVLITSCYADYNYVLDAVGNGCTFTSSTSGSTTDTYAWDFGDGSTSTLANPYHVFANNGWFMVQLTTSSSTDSTCMDTHYEYVHANNVCDASFYIVQDSAVSTSFLVYNNNYGTPSTSYLWNFGDGTTSTLQFPSHTFPDTVSYNLCLTVSDSAGCTDTYCDTINAGRSTGYITMTVVPPIGTAVVQQTEIIATLENYPNPFGSSTTINYAIDKDATVELSVIDLLGNKVATLEHSNKSAGTYSTVWNADGLAKGMYLLQMKANNQITTKKIVLNK